MVAWNIFFGDKFLGIQYIRLIQVVCLGDQYAIPGVSVVQSALGSVFDPFLNGDYFAKHDEQNNEYCNRDSIGIN